MPKDSLLGTTFQLPRTIANLSLHSLVGSLDMLSSKIIQIKALHKLRFNSPKRVSLVEQVNHLTSPLVVLYSETTTPLREQMNQLLPLQAVLSLATPQHLLLRKVPVEASSVPFKAKLRVFSSLPQVVDLLLLHK